VRHEAKPDGFIDYFFEIKKWSDKLGDSEPFSGILQSQTRDLFKSQSSGERIIVVFRLEKQAEKVVWFLIGANGPSARRIGGRVRNETIIGGGFVGNRVARLSSV
jgi:hypothetical protein